MKNKIVCPICGGNIAYWKEYFTEKRQAISSDGTLCHTVKKTPLEPGDSLEGLMCLNCDWVLNTVTDYETNTKYDRRKYDLLMKWVDTHQSELKV